MYTQEEVSHVFDGAIALVRKGFTQFADARNSEGLACDATDDDAIEWSILGAFEKAAIEAGMQEIFYLDGKKFSFIDHDLWTMILEIMAPIVGNLVEYGNSYARTALQVIRALERGRATLRKSTHAITCCSWKYTGCENVIGVCTIPNCHEDGDHQDEDRRCSDCERAEASADWDE